MFEGLRAFAYGITVRITHKCKTVLPGGNAVNSGQNVVKNAKCLFSNLGSEIYFSSHAFLGRKGRKDACASLDTFDVFALTCC
jgi:hypothetical protein